MFGKPSQAHPLPQPPPPDAHHVLLDPQSDQRKALHTQVCKGLRRYQRLKQPGLDASRSEHWEPLKHARAAEDALVEVVARSLLGHLPADALEAQLAGSLAAKSKPGGGRGLRVYVSGCAIRRIGAGALVRASAAAAKHAAGETQYAIARPGGCEVVHKATQTWLRADSGHAVVALDTVNAFLSLPRALMLQAASARCPELAATAIQWYSRRARHLWRDDQGRPHWVQAAEGVDPGCGLGAALFAIGTAPMNEELLAQARQLAPTAAVLCILDDVHVLVPTQRVDDAVALAHTAWRAHGLKLHSGKLRAFTEGVRPADAQTPFEDSFRCLGLTHQVLRAAAEEGSLPQGGAGTPREPIAQDAGSNQDPVIEALARLEHMMQLLAAGGGLTKETQLTLLRTYVVAVPVHRLRGIWAPRAARELDNKVRMSLQRILDVELGDDHWKQATLPAKQGGLGLLSAEGRAAPAFLASWASAAREVAQALGLNTTERFRLAAAGAVQECDSAWQQHMGRLVAQPTC